MSLIATSKNAVLIYTSAITGVKKLSGFSNENIIVIPDVDMIKTTIGNDGLISRSVIPAKISGSFSFFPGSPSLEFIYNLQQGVYATGVVLNGALNVVFPSLGKAWVYVDFAFESANKGIEAADEAKPVTIKWSSLLPNYSSIGALAETIIGVL